MISSAGQVDEGLDQLGDRPVQARFTRDPVPDERVRLATLKIPGGVEPSGVEHDPELVLEQRRQVLRPAHGHRRRADRIFEDQVPADDPGHQLAERGIGIRVRATRRPGPCSPARNSRAPRTRSRSRPAGTRGSSDGPASFLAASPVSTKIPAPIVAPTPSAVRATGPRAPRCSRSPPNPHLLEQGLDRLPRETGRTVVVPSLVPGPFSKIRPPPPLAIGPPYKNRVVGANGDLGGTHFAPKMNRGERIELPTWFSNENLFRGSFTWGNLAVP